MNDVNRASVYVDVEAAKIDDLLAGLRKRLWLIVLITLLTAGAAIGLAFWMTPVYRGTAILAPAHTDKNGMGDMGGAMGSVEGFAALAEIGLGNSDSATDEALAVLKSQQLTETFIEQNHLMQELFAGLWDARTGTWKAGIKKVPTIARG